MARFEFCNEDSEASAGATWKGLGTRVRMNISCWSKGSQRCVYSSGWPGTGSGPRHGGKNTMEIMQNQQARRKSEGDAVNSDSVWIKTVLMFLIEKGGGERDSGHWMWWYVRVIPALGKGSWGRRITSLRSAGFKPHPVPKHKYVLVTRKKGGDKVTWRECFYRGESSEDRGWCSHQWGGLVFSWDEKTRDKVSYFGRWIWSLHVLGTWPV